MCGWAAFVLSWGPGPSPGVFWGPEGSLEMAAEAAGRQGGGRPAGVNKPSAALLTPPGRAKGAGEHISGENHPQE